MHLERKLAVRLIETLVHITVNHRRWVYIAMAVVIAMSVWGITRIKVSGNITSDLPEGHQILTDLQFLQNEFGGSIPFEILINYKEPSRLGFRIASFCLPNTIRK